MQTADPAVNRGPVTRPKRTGAAPAGETTPRPSAAVCAPAASPPAAGAAEFQPVPPVPVWMAALLASQSRPLGSGIDGAIAWDCGSEHVAYTNFSTVVETVQPLGVALFPGDILLVGWIAGDTAYSLEVYRGAEQFVA